MPTAITPAERPSPADSPADLLLTLRLPRRLPPPAVRASSTRSPKASGPSSESEKSDLRRTDDNLFKEHHSFLSWPRRRRRPRPRRLRRRPATNTGHHSAAALQHLELPLALPQQVLDPIKALPRHVHVFPERVPHERPLRFRGHRAQRSPQKAPHSPLQRYEPRRSPRRQHRLPTRSRCRERERERGERERRRKKDLGNASQKGKRFKLTSRWPRRTERLRSQGRSSISTSSS